jgi:hypothetical protein
MIHPYRERLSSVVEVDETFSEGRGLANRDGGRQERPLLGSQWKIREKKA